MDMGPPGLIKHPGDKVFILIENRPTNRADSVPVPRKAIGTSGNIHEPVGCSLGGKCPGFNPFPLEKLDGADRTSPGHRGFPLRIQRPFFIVPIRFGKIRSGKTSLGSRTKKETVSKVKENHPDNNKA
jgi:hypothetical protein